MLRGTQNRISSYVFVCVVECLGYIMRRLYCGVLCGSLKYVLGAMCVLPE